MAKYIKLEDAINGDCMLIDKIECDNCPFYDETRFVCEMVEWLESLSTTDIVSSAEPKCGKWILKNRETDGNYMTRQEAAELIKRFEFTCDYCQCTNNYDCAECSEAFDMAIEALEQPTVQTIQDSCITIHGISSKYIEDKHDGKILVYTEKGCRIYHWTGEQNNECYAD